MLHANIRLLVGTFGVCLVVCMGALRTTPAAGAVLPGAAPQSRADSALVTQTTSIYLPFVQQHRVEPPTCETIPSEAYATLRVNPPPTDRPAEQHADLNLGLRGYLLAGGSLGLISIGGPTDGAAPQFPSLFADRRTPVFTANYQVYNWSWTCNCATTPVVKPPVTLAGMQTTPGETIGVPASDYDIGNGYQVLVLYASQTRITLKYTRDDNVIVGYTVHVENVCVEPRLLALYQGWDAGGRGQLPALRGAQAFGRAIGGEVAVAIQDSGAWMDPRSRKDWWQGR